MRIIARHYKKCVNFTSYKLLYVAFCFPILISCADYKYGSTLSRILNDGVLKVGSIYSSTSYFNGATSAEGFEYELSLGFAEYLGVKLEVYPYYSYAQLTDQLDVGRIDLIAANVTITEQRKAQYKFGPAYQHTNFELVYKKGENRPRDFSQLDGNLTIVANDFYREPLQNNDAVATINWQETNEKDIEELLEMVSNGELDYTVSDANILNIARRRFPNLGIGFSLTDTLQIAWMLNKDTDDSLRAALLEYFGTIKSSGALSALEDKYFGHVRQFDFVDTRAFMRAVDKKLPKYRSMFEAYAADIDWRLLAAMAYQESHWNPKAVSPTGVRGMMMLTRATAKDMGIESRIDAEQSISGGARYFASLLRRIPARIQEPDRLWMAMAAYNVGLGHLEDARRITEALGYNPDLWIDVKKHLPLLRQKKYYKHTRYGYARGNEAVNYVENIRRYYDSLVWLESQTSLPEVNEPIDKDEASESNNSETDNSVRDILDNASADLNADQSNSDDNGVNDNGVNDSHAGPL
ncbi:membrane-bound lytic murein transglycosylase MltF [Agaribacter marinus]|uniref:Membrane-bound lytic murein transglycosylase F n=1 Tax=Agaribacter marinus TaxID=1431249 RepID=A0AA37SYG1_9ALTE|nr:membrane-bound lytic murein transglycosylase MltF [Agaribacter marinus]GLR70814.1 membrane-bound lytic murein transglycosylase F [Agaribacter marinus]